MPVHAKDGWHFERLEAGSVRVFKRVPILQPTETEGQFREVGHFESTSFLLDADTWTRVVAGVSGSGDAGKALDAAYRLHLTG